ncbi:CopG family transcriptional regulator [Fusobacterium nucleatum]|uniref:CopG family transcriptional regulator n=1 Tax=Fusobacterium nucleatum TaxID=851 RepID=UPI00201A9CAC|nr:CopG family transcriptional regulator [Fusobacterium nucleatum]MCL4591262.1 CopG family transcriptional regulator [Fusobacterium nucleatum YWH7053]
MIKFTLRLTEDEKKLLDIKADELGKSKNEVLKFLINKKLEDIKKEFDLLNELENNYKELGFQIKKIGTVLNQINKNFYLGKNIKIEEINEVLEELWQSIKVLKE